MIVFAMNWHERVKSKNSIGRSFANRAGPDLLARHASPKL
jgi:hypothetical protein